jgi:predicted amidohydrolase
VALAQIDGRSRAPRGEPALVHAELDLGAVRRRRRELPLLKDPRLGLVRREVGRLLDDAGDGAPGR